MQNPQILYAKTNKWVQVSVISLVCTRTDEKRPVMLLADWQRKNDRIKMTYLFGNPIAKIISYDLQVMYGQTAE
jgi:hypothetical protein